MLRKINKNNFVTVGSVKSDALIREETQADQCTLLPGVVNQSESCYAGNNNSKIVWNPGMVKLIFMLVVSCVLEWYNFSLYALLSRPLEAHFFAKADISNSFMMIFGVFAIGYFARPIGGLIMGHIGDRHSRKRALIISLLAMGLSTFAIGLLPAYRDVGLLAPILLISLRLIQGLALGGEHPGISVILTEIAKCNQKAFITSFSVAGAMLGSLVGVAVIGITRLFLSHADFFSWGWRIPFLMGLVLAAVALLLRLQMSKAFFSMNSFEPVKFPLGHLLANHFKTVVYCFLLLVSPSVFSGLLLIYLVTHLIQTLHYSYDMAFSIYLMVTLVILIAYPLAGRLVDYFGNYKRWLIITGCLLLVSVFPLQMMAYQGVVYTWVAYLIFALLYCLAYAPLTPYVVLIFPEEVRFTGFAFADGIAFSLVMGATPMLMNWLESYVGSYSLSLLCVVAFIISLTSVFLFKSKLYFGDKEKGGVVW